MKRLYTPDQIEAARTVLSSAAMMWANVNIDHGGALTGVDIPDSDCHRYLDEQRQGVELDIANYLGAG